MKKQLLSILFIGALLGCQESTSNDKQASPKIKAKQMPTYLEQKESEAKNTSTEGDILNPNSEQEMEQAELQQEKSSSMDGKRDGRHWGKNRDRGMEDSSRGERPRRGWGKKEKIEMEGTFQCTFVPYKKKHHTPKYKKMNASKHHTAYKENNIVSEEQKWAKNHKSKKMMMHKNKKAAKLKAKKSKPNSKKVHSQKRKKIAMESKKPMAKKMMAPQKKEQETKTTNPTNKTQA